MASKIHLQRIRQTVNFHYYEGRLSNGDTWQIYMPKKHDEEVIVYVGRKRAPRPVPVNFPPDPGCNCKGAHYHPPTQHKRRVAKKSTTKTKAKR